MKKTKIQTVILIVVIVFFVGTMGTLFFMSQIDKQSEETTTLYPATIAFVQVTETGENIHIEILTKEYSSALYISNTIGKNVNVEDIRQLKSGQKIWFRIENIKSDQINHADFIDIVSLKTETADIFSLENYNQWIADSAYPARRSAVILAGLFLLIALFCLLSIKRAAKK